MFFKQSVSLVAYEGVRLAARRSATSADVIAHCQQMMQEQRIDNGEIILSPLSIDNLPPTTPITLTIRATQSTFGMGQTNPKPADSNKHRALSLALPPRYASDLSPHRNQSQDYKS